MKNGEYAQKIPKEENDRRLFLIDIHNGRCPLCETNTITRFVDESYIHGFEQGQYIFLCDECGVVARKDINLRFK